MELLARLRVDYPEFEFVLSDRFMWSPSGQQVHLDKSQTDTPESAWSTLHELSHGLLGHTDYTTDIELVGLESDAWEHAKQLAAKYDIQIPQDHIEDCLDTYRDWLLARAKCPECDLVGLQGQNLDYNCPNCSSSWKVPADQLCAVRRAKTK